MISEDEKMLLEESIEAINNSSTAIWEREELSMHEYILSAIYSKNIYKILRINSFEIIKWSSTEQTLN